MILLALYQNTLKTLKQSEIAECLKLVWIPLPNFSFPEKVEGEQK